MLSNPFTNPGTHPPQLSARPYAWLHTYFCSGYMTASWLGHAQQACFKPTHHASITTDQGSACTWTAPAGPVDLAEGSAAADGPPVESAWVALPG